ELIGGYFNGHPWHQNVRVIVEDTNHPATRHLGSTFQITDEVYQFRAPYDCNKLLILMRLDTEGVDRPSASVNGKRLTDRDVLELTVREGKPEPGRITGHLLSIRPTLPRRSRLSPRRDLPGPRLRHPGSGTPRRILTAAGPCGPPAA